MFEQHLAALSKRQIMLLLTGLTFGGSEATKAFVHLAPDEEELLTQRAQALLTIPKERRLPLVAQELRRLFGSRRRALAGVDPARLAALLANERPGLVEVLLRPLPAGVAESVREAIGPARFVDAPAVELKPEVLAVVRWRLEEALGARAPQGASFRFTDLLVLQPREILAACDRMGARALSTSLAGLSPERREELLAKLPPDQRALARKAADAGASRKLPEPEAQRMLELHGAGNDPSAGLRSAGAQRLARAALAQSPEFAQRLGQRFAGAFAQVYGRWIKEERGRAPARGDGGRGDFVEQLERLAQRGLIDRPVRLAPPALPPPQGSIEVPGGGAVRSDASSSRRERPESGGSPKPSASSGRRAPAAPSAGGERSERGVVRAASVSKPPAPRAAAAGRVAAGAESEPTKLRTNPGGRVLRDGRPLVRDEAEAAGKAPKEGKLRHVAVAAVVQSIPRRRGAAAPKPRDAAGGRGRGPKDGSR